MLAVGGMAQLTYSIVAKLDTIVHAAINPRRGDYGNRRVVVAATVVESSWLSP
jgi:hypothetical protein